MRATLDEQLADAEHLVTELRKARDEERLARRASVTPRYEHTISFVEEKWEKINDPAVKLVRLEGKCVNKAECEEVGQHSFFEGGMTYLFNTATGKIITSAGGGNIYVNTPEAYEALAGFILSHGGGNVSHIVAAHPTKGWGT